VIVDRLTGQVRPAQIFVAVMGASNFTYAEASWTQALADWIGAHTRAFAALGGVPKLLAPDNTKVAVIKACLYEPQVNRTYAEMAAHYDTAILLARPRRPRDKAEVEVAVLIIERWLLGRVRHRRFYSLAEAACRARLKAFGWQGTSLWVDPRKCLPEPLAFLADRAILRLLGRSVEPPPMVPIWKDHRSARVRHRRRRRLSFMPTG
jgi:hypothetical protein